METAVDRKQLILDYYQAFERKDFRAFMEYYAENAIVVDVTWQGAWKGLEELSAINRPFFERLQYVSFDLETFLIRDNMIVVKGTISARFHSNITYDRVPFTQWFELEGDKIIKETDFIAHTDQVLTRKKKLESTIMELVVYKIKPEANKGYIDVLKAVQEELKKMQGFVSYKTLKSVESEGLYTDMVEWKTLDDAKVAAAEIEQRKPFEHFLKSFQHIITMDHYTFFTF